TVSRVSRDWCRRLTSDAVQVIEFHFSCFALSGTTISGKSRPLRQPRQRPRVSARPESQRGKSGRHSGSGRGWLTGAALAGRSRYQRRWTRKSQLLEVQGDPSVGAPLYSSFQQSSTQSQTLPCMSKSPKTLARKEPTGAVNGYPSPQAVFLQGNVILLSAPFA